MSPRSTASSIDEYVAEFPAETRKVLEELRSLIRASAPEAMEKMSYAIPTFDLHGKHLVHVDLAGRCVNRLPLLQALRGQAAA
jgi:uncharacterized protein YdhG (YjbR/CyaY superfamily)